MQYYIFKYTTWNIAYSKQKFKVRDQATTFTHF